MAPEVKTKDSVKPTDPTLVHKPTEEGLKSGIENLIDNATKANIELKEESPKPVKAKDLFMAEVKSVLKMKMDSQQLEQSLKEIESLYHLYLD